MTSSTFLPGTPASSQPLVQLAQRIGHAFANPALLQRALTHRSFSADHNERLEFLGDSVLGLAISSLLYSRLEQAPEGDLSRIRANLVKQDSLHRIALKLDLAASLRLGEGELRSGGLKRPSILADAFEAVVGAVYLDAGFVPAQALVHRLFADVDINSSMSAAGKDPKTALQEWLQGRKMALPSYQVADIEGAAHQQTFVVDCLIEALQLRERGSGPSRRAAEQDAASKMLQRLQQAYPQGKPVARTLTIRSRNAGQRKAP